MRTTVDLLVRGNIAKRSRQPSRSSKSKSLRSTLRQAGLCRITRSGVESRCGWWKQPS